MKKFKIATCSKRASADALLNKRCVIVLHLFNCENFHMRWPHLHMTISTHYLFMWCIYDSKWAQTNGPLVIEGKYCLSLYIISPNLPWSLDILRAKLSSLNVWGHNFVLLTGTSGTPLVAATSSWGGTREWLAVTIPHSPR